MAEFITVSDAGVTSITDLTRLACCCSGVGRGEIVFMCAAVVRIAWRRGIMTCGRLGTFDSDDLAVFKSPSAGMLGPGVSVVVDAILPASASSAALVSLAAVMLVGSGRTGHWCPLRGV